MGHQKLLSGSSSICGDLPGSSRTRARCVRNFSKFPGWPDFNANRGCWTVTVFCVQRNRPVYHSTKEMHLWNLPCHCITTGTMTIRSMKHFEKRSWGMIWTTPVISSTTCGSGTWTICSKCADKRALVGSIAQNQQSRPRLAERTHTSPAATRRSELRPQPEVPEHPNKYGNTQQCTK